MISLLALITARSGSLRLANKNALPFAGTSLLDIVVVEALRAERVSQVGLSTDSRDYLDIARRNGLNESYIRPSALAGPEATSAACVIDYLDWIKGNGGQPPSHVVLLQPTSPLRTARHIDDAIATWIESGRASLVSVTPAAPSENYIVMRRADGHLQRPPADSGDHYVFDGSIYIAPVEMIRDTGRFWDETSALYVTQYPRFFDIDTEADFVAAAAVRQAQIS